MVTVWIFAGQFLGFLPLAALCDVAESGIPNRLTATMAAGRPVALLLLMRDAGPGALHTGEVVLGIGWERFEMGCPGDGDAKLATASSLWAEAMLVFVLATALFGALLTTALLIFGRWNAGWALVGVRWRERLQAERISVPYGGAMTPAGAVALSVCLAGLA